MTWARGTLTTGVSVLKWQTLQDLDPAASIAAPFDRMPQLNANYLRADLPGGFDWNVAGELTRFTVDRSFYCAANSGSAYCYQPNAARMVVQNQLSRPVLVPYGYLTPKLMVQARQYQYETPYQGIYNENGRPTRTDGLAVPTFSLDTGAVLERRTNLFGNDWTQTLEPRAFYVYTPFRDQNDLPNYDTGFNDFNFATVFTENAFSGADRISDSHTFTIGATSRLINPDTGAEGARFGLAQRLRLSDQRVLLTTKDTPISGTFSDILAGASLYLTPRLSLDSMVQYNQELNLSEKYSLGARLSPTSYRTVTAAYRYQRQSSETVDVSWQWPINDLWADFGVDAQQGKGFGENRWFSLGRMNYSMLEKRLVESMLGFEYDAGCWVARYALTRTQISSDTATTRLMFQLEFNDFSRLGGGALSSVQDNISRYQNLREPLKFTPSRFGQYE
jgi:LPS-assembly protein